jgi:putative hydrolase of the HAD superfamily
VLVHPDWERIDAILAGFGVRGDPSALAAAELAAMRALDEPELIARSDDRGRLPPFIAGVYARVGVTALPTAGMDALMRIHADENLWSSVPAEVPAVLAAWKARGLRLVVVSNANGTVRAKLDRVGLGRWLDLVVDSAEEGLEKPDPRLFRRALERAGADAGRTVHIGDLFHIDVVGARAAGIAAILVDKGDLHVGRDATRVRSLADAAALLDSSPKK